MPNGMTLMDLVFKQPRSVQVMFLDRHQPRSISGPSGMMPEGLSSLWLP